MPEIKILLIQLIKEGLVHTKGVFLAQAGLLAPEAWHKRQKKRGKERGKESPGERSAADPGVPG
ncbi:hypothetical protein AB9K36_32240 [Klebsiella michiganensis]